MIACKGVVYRSLALPDGRYDTKETFAKSDDTARLSNPILLHACLKVPCMIYAHLPDSRAHIAWKCVQSLYFEWD